MMSVRFLSMLLTRHTCSFVVSSHIFYAEVLRGKKKPLKYKSVVEKIRRFPTCHESLWWDCALKSSEETDIEKANYPG
jgi:hypothetical protein